MRKVLGFIAVSLTILAGCGDKTPADPMQSERCQSIIDQQKNAAHDFTKFSWILEDPESGGHKGWTIDEAIQNNRKHPNEDDKYVIRLYFTQFQFISDSPECFEPDVVADARQMLR
jgi:hypothetical protein